MANEPPHHTYREITDNPSDNLGCAWFASGCLFIIAVPFVLLTILAFVFDWQIIRWVFLSLSALFILLALVERLSFCKLPNKLNEIVNRPSPRLSEAQLAKDFLGFDFGDDFKLKTTGSHDYAEILLDFKENGFDLLKNFCEDSMALYNRIDGEDEITITEVKKHLVIDEGCDFIGKPPITKSGYTKIESYYAPQLSKDGNLWITSMLGLEVDYECRTLKMSWTGW